jgi:hypothetical protein
MVRLSIIAACVVTLVSCDEVGKGKTESKAASQSAEAASKSPSGPAGMPVATAGSKSATSAGPSAGAGVSGVVLETFDAGKYSYVRLEGAGGKQWAAVPRSKLTVGQRVRVLNPMLMRNFHSKTLDRDFAEIYFGTLGGPGAMPDSARKKMMGAAARKGAMPGAGVAAGDDLTKAHRGVATGQKPAALPKPLEKAKGGKSVAEIYQQKSDLAGKKVLVRGKVVKVNNGIMGRNWAHLQDGTRSGDDGFDLTITTKEQLQVGQIVEVSGTLAVDRDFGAGYRYPVLLERASVR